MKMALLKSVTNIPGIDYYEYKDSLYYNKYNYRLKMKIEGVRFTYWCNTIDDLLDKINKKNKRTFLSLKPEDLNKITDNLEALKEFIDIRSEQKLLKSCTIRLESNTISMFSNDLEHLKKIEQRIGQKYKLDYTEVKTFGFSGVKYFANEPTHKYRIYLKSKRIDEKIHDDLADTIEKQTKIYPSRALNRWLRREEKNRGNWAYLWTSAAHFLEFDEESTNSYLSLIHGDILGKKYKLEKRPDIV